MHVAGRSSAGGGYIWTDGSGVLLLGEDDAVGVNSTGTEAYGNMDDPATSLGSAGVYTVGSGWQELLGLPGDPGCSGTLSSAYGWSNDGGVATGLAWEGCMGRAFKWTPLTGVTMLPMSGTNSTRGNVVSGDGTFIGGWDRGNSSSNKAALWKPDGTVSLPLAGTTGNPDGSGETWALSTDGTYAAGRSPGGAFLFNESDGITLLDFFSPGNLSEARGVSDDGETVVGWEGGSGPFGSPPEAWIWRKGSGIELLTDVLTQYGVAAPPYDLQRAMDVTPDGLTIVGHGLQQPGFFANTGWMIELPPSPWDHLGGGTPGANGVPNLTGQGSCDAGSMARLRLEDAAASSSAFLGVSVTPAPIPLFGGILHANPLDVVLVIATDANGEFESFFTWPPSLMSGVSLTFQVGVIDGAAAFTVALSNGLEGTTL